MVAARAEFLGAGHYLPLANVLVELSKDHAAGARLIIEAGAGTGYYTASVLDALPKSFGLAIDLSKCAVRRAAKAHGRLSAAVADIWEGLPLKDHSVDLALNVFAPRPVLELFRTLQRDGKLIVAIPTEQHMAELRESLGLLQVDPNKELRLSRARPIFHAVGASLLSLGYEIKSSADSVPGGDGAFCPAQPSSYVSGQN